MAYAIGSLGAVLCVSFIYHGYFYYYIVVSGKRNLPFVSLVDFLPTFHAVRIFYSVFSLCLLFTLHFVLNKVFFVEKVSDRIGQFSIYLFQARLSQATFD